MPAPIISGVINFLSSNFSLNVWDGEIPRYDSRGNPINPNSTTTPTDWPAVRVQIVEPGFERMETFEDPYDDRGDLLIEIYDTTRANVETAASNVEQLFLKASNWPLINIAGDPSNPNYIIQMLLKRWWTGQDAGPDGGWSRTDQGELLYRADLLFDTHIHGAVSTQ